MKTIVVDAADQTYLTDMDIYFQEDDLWVLVTQHVERWSYSDTGPTPEEEEERVLVICSGLSSSAETISQLVNRSININDNNQWTVSVILSNQNQQNFTF